MVRVLLVFAGTMENGGIEKYLYNLVRNSSGDVCYDLLLLNGAPNDWTSFITKKGGKVISFNTRDKRHIRLKNIKLLLSAGKYNVIHFHTDDFAVSFLIDLVCCGFKNIFSHSHNNKGNSPQFVHKLKSIIIGIFSKKRFACSNSAGRWLFGRKKFIVIENGIDFEKYRFSLSNRKKIRTKYSIPNDAFVIGCVGHFMKGHKNQSALIRIVEQLPNNYFLMLIGDGEEMQEHKDYISANNLHEKVFLLGNRDDANEFYSAFDIYVLPSFHEGSPYTCIEAICSGLNVVVSDKVPIDKRLESCFSVVGLDCSDKVWAQNIIENVSLIRKDNISLLSSSGYNYIDSALRMVEEYRKYEK